MLPDNLQDRENRVSVKAAHEPELYVKDTIRWPTKREEMKLLRYASDKILEILPARFAAALEFHSNSRRFFYPWGAAMNGQTARLEICRRIICQLPVDVIVETGTYRGVTTEWFASFGKPVLSVEVSPRFHAFSQMRLKAKPNVFLVLGDSKDALGRELAERIRGRFAFAYLDAHWLKHLPLREEISDIARLANDFVIIIDDFQVPGEPAYEFDDYGENGACTLEFIAPSMDESMAAYFPTTPAGHETGRKRGYVLVARGKEAIGFLDSLDLLRRAA